MAASSTNVDLKRQASSSDMIEAHAKQQKIVNQRSSSQPAQTLVQIPEEYLQVKDLVCLKPHGYKSDLTDEFVLTSINIGRFIHNFTCDGEKMIMDLKPPRFPMRVNMEEAKALWKALKAMIQTIENSQSKQLNLKPGEIITAVKGLQKHEKDASTQTN